MLQLRSLQMFDDSLITTAETEVVKFGQKKSAGRGA
jgi:hypothetical protein